MDIDRLAMFGGQAEHDVQMPHRVAVDGAGIDSAHHVGAPRQRRVHHIRDPLLANNAGLREGHDLYVHDTAQ